MIRNFLSSVALVATLCFAVTASAQCTNCGTAMPVYSTPISVGYSSPVMYGQPMQVAQPMQTYTNYRSCCNSCQPISACNAPCNRTVINRCQPARYTNCGGCNRTARVRVLGRRNANCRVTYVSTCGGCNSCCPTMNSCCSTCGGQTISGGCINCANSVQSGVIMGDEAAPVEPTADDNNG